MTTADWRPDVGASVRNRDAELFEVVARFDGAGYGEYVVLKRAFAGGWGTRLVTHADWVGGGFVVVP
jgi:hypothetical protein